MVYTGDLKSPVARHVGSTPTPGTGKKQLIASCGGVERRSCISSADEIASRGSGILRATAS
jgi:hypothetical protein